jgi:hypothetical protein
MPLVTRRESAFQRLMKRAQQDARLEPEMLRAMLDARLYALLPVSDDSGRTQLICFTRPDGVSFIPFFSDDVKARASAGTAARVVALSGRDLLDATRGATLVLDPNDTNMTLYPEEVAALLDAGQATVAPVAVEGPSLELSAPEAGDRWVLDCLRRALGSVDGAVRVHLAAARPMGSTDGADRLLALVAAPESADERVARALAIAVSIAPEELRLPLDLTIYRPGGALSVVQAAGLERAWSAELTPDRAVP